MSSTASCDADKSVSCNGDICSNTQGCGNKAIREVPEITKKEVKQYTCYNCNVIVDKMVSIPDFVQTDIHQIIQRRQMEDEIKDFLL